MLLDESISGLRAALGITSFDLALVASPAEATLEPLQRHAGLREQLDQVFRRGGDGRAPVRSRRAAAVALVLLIAKRAP